MIFGLFNKYNKTNFKAGGLILDEIPLGAPKLIKEVKFVAPRKIDFRDMCLQSSDQGQTSQCAGFATAGFVEVQNWKVKHYPEQVDGPAIYKEAKIIDGNGGEGTTLGSAAKAALNLNLYGGKIVYVNNSIDDVKFAIHQYGVAVAGFLITNEWNEVEKATGFIRDLGTGATKRGGHAVLICGYDDNGCYIQNSWGESWGIYGFGILRWRQFSEQLMQSLVIAA